MRRILKIILISHVLLAAQSTCSSLHDLRVQLNNWVEAYQNQGFPFAQAHLQSDSCANHVKIQLLRGEGWVWDSPKARVPLKTKSQVLERMSLISRGAPVQLMDLEKSRRLLARRGYFMVGDSVRLYRVENRNRLIPVFELIERMQSSAEAIVMIAQDEQGENLWEANARVELMNLKGTGRDLMLMGSRSKFMQSIRGEWLEPGLLDSRWDLRFAIHMEDDSVLTQFNLRAALEWQMDFDWRLSIAGGMSTLDSSSQLRMGDLKIVYDHRDRIPLTREGLWIEALLRGVDRQESTHVRYAATELQGRYFWRIFPQSSVQFGLRMHSLLPRENRYVKQELFLLGGNLLPGYWPNSIPSPQFSIIDLAWVQSMGSTAAMIFADHAVVRPPRPNLGWNAYWDYGFGFEQDRQGVGIVFRCAWSRHADLLEALLSIGVRSRF